MYSLKDVSKEVKEALSKIRSAYRAINSEYKEDETNPIVTISDLRKGLLELDEFPLNFAETDCGR